MRRVAKFFVPFWPVRLVLMKGEIFDFVTLFETGGYLTYVVKSFSFRKKTKIECGKESMNYGFWELWWTIFTLFFSLSFRLNWIIDKVFRLFVGRTNYKQSMSVWKYEFQLHKNNWIICLNNSFWINLLLTFHLKCLFFEGVTVNFMKSVEQLSFAIVLK